MSNDLIILIILGIFGFFTIGPVVSQIVGHLKNISNYLLEIIIFSRDAHHRNINLEKDISAMKNLLVSINTNLMLSSAPYPDEIGQLSGPPMEAKKMASYEEIKKLAGTLQELIKNIVDDPNYKSPSSKEDVDRLIKFFQNELETGKQQPPSDGDDFDLDMDDEDDTEDDSWKHPK